MVIQATQTQPLSLQRKPTFLAQQKFLQTLFRDEYVDKRLRHFDQYFKTYEKELAKLSSGRFQHHTLNNLLLTHEELIDFTAVIKRSLSLSKNEFLAVLGQTYPSADTALLVRSLQLCIKIWLMVEIGEPGHQLQSGLSSPLNWDQGQSISFVVDKAFPVSRWNLEAKDSRLHPSFTAVFMTDVCGLTIEWTDNLTRHLWLDRRERILHIFTDKAFVAAHLDAAKHAADAGSEYPFKEKLLVETVWSLNLLFPHWDESTNRFLEHHRQVFHQIGPFDSPPILNLLEFEYWRDRLAEVHDAIFLAPPVSWAQLLKDRRNPQQYWTFWIALIILVLTLFSTIASIAQVVAAFKYN